MFSSNIINRDEVFRNRVGGDLYAFFVTGYHKLQFMCISDGYRWDNSAIEDYRVLGEDPWPLLLDLSSYFKQYGNPGFYDIFEDTGLTLAKLNKAMLKAINKHNKRKEG